MPTVETVLSPRLRRWRRRAASGLVAALLACVPALRAQTLTPTPQAVIGEWWTPQHDGVIRIWACGDAVCGTLVGMDYQGAMPLTYAGTPQCGFSLMRGFRPDADGVLTGSIISPDSGKTYQATLRPDGPDGVRLRGYILVPLLGSTQHWKRFRGTLTRACHIVAG